MKRVIPRPRSMPLYYLRHHALRQIGCPMCQSRNVTLDMSKIVTTTGPTNHPAFGPIVGSVASAGATCGAGHKFLIRIANHRDVLLIWADVPTEIDADDNTNPLFVGDYSFYGDHIFEEAPKDSAYVKEIENMEKSGEGQGESKDTSSHDDGDCDGLECSECTDNECPGNPAYKETHNVCHADVDVDAAVTDYEDTGVVNVECLTCPNSKCPVYGLISGALGSREHNVNAVKSGCIGDCDAPHDEFKPDKPEET